MNKKLIAAAVAAVVCAPLSVQAAPTVYGGVHLSIENNDTDGGTERLSVLNNTSKVGVKGSENLGNGLTAIYKLEWNVNLTGNNDGRGNVAAFGNARNSYIGLKGSFGTALVGRHDSVYKMVTGKFDVNGDTRSDIGDNLMDADNQLQHQRVGSTILYQSPKFSGFQVLGNIIAGEEDGNAAGAAGDADGLTDGYALAGVYSNGPLYVTAAVQTFTQEINNRVDDDDSYVIGAEYNFGPGEVAVVYQNRETGRTANNDEIDTFIVSGKYKLGGNNTLTGIYMTADSDQDQNADGRKDDQDQYAIALYHHFSKRTSAYVQYTSLQNDDSRGDQDVFALGMYHNF